MQFEILMMIRRFVVDDDGLRQKEIIKHKTKLIQSVYNSLFECITHECDWTNEREKSFNTILYLFYFIIIQNIKMYYKN